MRRNTAISGDFAQSCTRAIDGSSLAFELSDDAVNPVH
jgi:hypothetical protein